MAFETVTGYCWPQSVEGGGTVGAAPLVGRRTARVRRGRTRRGRAHGRVQRRRRPGRQPRHARRTPTATGAAGPRRSCSTSSRPGGPATTRSSWRSTSTASRVAATPSSWCGPPVDAPTLAGAAGPGHQHLARLQRLRRPQPLHRRHARCRCSGRCPPGTCTSPRGSAAASPPPRRPTRRWPPTSATCSSTTSRRTRGRRAGPTGSCRSCSGPRANGLRRRRRHQRRPRGPPRRPPRRRPFAVPVGGPRRVLVGPDARHRRGVHRPGRQRRVPLGQHVVLAGAPRGPDAGGPGRHDGRLQGLLQAGPGVRHRPRRRAHQHLVRPPDRAAREPHDRRELRPRRLPPHRQAGHDTAPAATRSTGPTTGCSTARASATATCWAPAATTVGYECDGCDFTYRDGLPYPTGVDGTPADFEILGTAPAAHFTRDTATRPPAPERAVRGGVHRRRGCSTAAERRRTWSGSPTATPCSAPTRRPAGGVVVTSGSTDWAHGLAGRDPQVEQITRNILDRLGT